MNTEAPALAVNGVHKRFGRLNVLDGISLELAAGETLALFGRNGAGKTTLLRIVSSLLRPTSGRVHVHGSDILKSSRAARGHIGFLSHQTYLYDDLTAEENLRFYARLYAIPKPKERIGQLLEEVGLTSRASTRVRHFSRGMQQRLGLARALLHDPSLLLLDEPFSGLDSLAVQIILDIIRNAQAQGQGRTCILTTHNLELGIQCASKIAILEKGQLGYYGEVPYGGLEAARALYGKFLGGRPAEGE